jgi:cytochrome P450
VSVETFDPFAPEIRANPYPTYQRMREAGPVYWTPDGTPMLTRYEDIIGILRDHDRWSNDSSNSKHAEAAGDADLGGGMLGAINARPMLFTDPPDHTRLRGLVNKAFTPRVVDRLRPRMEAIVDELLDEVAGAGTMDIIEQVAFPLPVIMIAELLGVPASDRDLLKGWSVPLARTIDPMDNISPEFVNEIASAGLAFISYFAQLINERRTSPSDDLLSGLIAAEEEGDKLTQEEVIVNLILLLIAGHETTTNLIGNGLHLFLTHPESLQRLRDEPQLIATAVEECLRIESSNQLGNRLVVERTVVRDVVLEPGTYLTLCIGAANRDPEEFADPDRFDIARQPNRHLAFAAGAHACAGMAVARLEGRVAIARALLRFPQLQLVAEPARGRRARFRGFTSIPARIG